MWSMMFTHDRPPHLSPLSHVVCFSVCALEPIRPVYPISEEEVISIRL